MASRARLKAASQAEPIEPESTTQPVKVKVTKREEYIETRKPDLPIPQVDLAEPDPDPEEYDPPMSDFERFLDSLEEENLYMMRVDSLPEFDSDGRVGIKAPKEFCRMLYYRKPELMELKYLGDIQRQYGGGAYWLTLRDPNGGSILKQWAEFIKRPIEQQLTQASNPNQPIIYPGYQQAAPPIDPLEQLLKTAEQYQKIKRLFEPAESEKVSNPTAPAAEKPPLLERVLEAVIVQAIDKKDETTIDRVLNVLAPNKEPGIMESLGDTLKEMLPLALQLFTQAQQRQLQTAGPLPVTANPGLTGMTAMAPHNIIQFQNPAETSKTQEVTAFTQPDSGATGEIDLLEAMYQLIDGLLELAEQPNLEEQAKIINVDRGAAWVKEFEATYPAAAFFLAGLIYGTPESALQGLAALGEDYADIANSAPAKEYITELQKRLRGK